jgi:hypothetical protein
LTSGASINSRKPGGTVDVRCTRVVEGGGPTSAVAVGDVADESSAAVLA